MAIFTETENKTETSTSFGFNRTNQLDNQLDFSSAVPRTGYSPYQTTTYKEQETEEESTPSYEVEREYNINGIQEDEVIIPTFMPTLKSGQPEVQAPADYKIKLNARGKIIASVFGVVVALLIAFMVYNAVVISKLTSTLKLLESEEVSKNVGVTQLETTYSEITAPAHLENRAEGLGLEFSPQGSDVKISLKQRPQIKEPSKSTNWFDSLCEFFSNLF